MLASLVSLFLIRFRKKMLNLFQYERLILGIPIYREDASLSYPFSRRLSFIFIYARVNSTCVEIIYRSFMFVLLFLWTQGYQLNDCRNGKLQVFNGYELKKEKTTKIGFLSSVWFFFSVFHY